ncbi:hypothetical protein GCM10010433_00200 [Streptomyces pulveraceus]
MTAKRFTPFASDPGIEIVATEASGSFAFGALDGTLDPGFRVRGLTLAPLAPAMGFSADGKPGKLVVAAVEGGAAAA